MDEEALTLEEGRKKVSIQNTVEAIVEAVLCKYEQGYKKESSDVNVQTITLEDDAYKANSDKNICAVPTEYAKKSNSENVEALHTEYESKYAISESMLPIPTEEDIKETISEFYICNPKFPREYGFSP